MKLNEIKDIEGHINAFRNLMIDILRRRAVFRLFEKNLVGKASKDAVLKNTFVSFYVIDYTRNQLIDLRKFFETDNLSYKLAFLLDYIGDINLKKEHTRLFQEWKEKFQDSVNKIIAHLDKNTDDVAREVNKKDIDNLVDKINQLLDSIVDGLNKKGTVVLEKGLRDLNGNFLNKNQEEGFEEYLQWLCRS